MHAIRFPSLSSLILASIALVWCVGGFPPGQSIAVAQRAESEAEVDPLVARQTSVAARYARLEELLLRLSDAEARENPERAALLRRVARQSRERFVLEKLRGASELIASGQLSKAVDDQKVAAAELDGLLKLLLSEDRSSRIRDEKKRIAEIIKQLRLTERNERSVRARTENGVEFDEVLKEQEEISKRAEQLRQELQDDDETSSPAEGSEQPTSDGETQESSAASESPPVEQAEKSDAEKSADQKPGAEQSDAEQGDAEQGDAEQSEGEPSAGEMSEGEQAQSGQSESEQSAGEQSAGEQSAGEQSAGEKAEAEPSAGENAEGQQSDQQQSGQQQSGQQNSPQPQQPKSPEQEAQSQLEKAIERMQQAQEKLAQEKRGEATAQQRLAEEELRKAIDKLEKILRQLREEEIQRELAKLEARLRKMAAMQSAVLDETVRLAQTPRSQRDRTTDLKAGDLSFEEQKITLEADRAMLLLREEGSSVAFPEVISQLRDDTQRVATRLGQSKIDLVTQGIQNDILAALEEMIAALAQAQRDNEKKQQEQQQQQGQPAGQGAEEQPLVQALAELKLLRTMQTRIQGSTNRYADLIDAEEADPQAQGGEDILPLLRNLAQRQDRLYQITRDLVNKRNR